MRMTYPAYMTGWGFLPYGPLTGTVPNVPEFYWNAVSDEQRWKQLCLNLAALQKWTQDYTTVNNANLEELDSRFPVTDDELAEDVPDTRGGTIEQLTIPANESLVVVGDFPSHLGSGLPSVTLTPLDPLGHNIAALVTGVTETGFTARLVNNSLDTATISLAYNCIWNQRPQPSKQEPTKPTDQQGADNA